MSSSFQPFLISEFKTGLFNYLEPWIRPLDAFQPLENAYIYRGTLNKRQGYSIFGQMVYRDTVVLATGNGGATYSGTLAIFPIRPGTFFAEAVEAGPVFETFSDDGLGVLTGSAGGTGTINYTTGAYSLTFNAAIANPNPVIGGYTYNASVSAQRPIMGLKQWQDDTTGVNKLVAMDTRRAAVYNDSTNQFDPLYTFSQPIWIGTAAGTTNTTLTGWAAVAPYTQGIAPYSVSITDGTDTITDDGVGGFLHNGNALPDGTNFAAAMNAGAINYATGSIILTLVAAAPNITFTMSGTLTGDYFTGNNTNFFNATNWEDFLFFVNNKDPITTFDGTDLGRRPFSITEANYTTFVNNVGTCLDIDVYKSRFIVELPTIINAGALNGFDAQSFRWSAQLNSALDRNIPFNLIADIAGNGGELSAPTGDFIRSSEFLRDVLIVMFSNSSWIFRFTGISFDPFRWDKINNTKSTNAPYGTIPYDERITAMGSKGLIACDGVNVQRYDISVIDQFLDINQEKFSQCFGQRFDTTNQSWMLYPSAEANASISDKILVYNFIENTWSTYLLPLSCLGLYFTTQDRTWASFSSIIPMNQWKNSEFPWNFYLLQGLSPILLGGGHTGYVYTMNSGVEDHPSSDSVGVPISTTITSTRWNPFAKSGERVFFGYIDFYYAIDPDCVISINFSVDNSSLNAVTRSLTLTGPVQSDTAMQRVYINAVGEFLQMTMTTSSVSSMKILGMILWAKPSGRITP